MFTAAAILFVALCIAAAIRANRKDEAHRILRSRMWDVMDALANASRQGGVRRW